MSGVRVDFVTVSEGALKVVRSDLMAEAPVVGDMIHLSLELPQGQEQRPRVVGVVEARCWVGQSKVEVRIK